MSDTNRRKVRLTGSRWPETGDPKSDGDPYFERGQVYEIDFVPTGGGAYDMFTREGKRQSCCWLDPADVFGAELLPEESATAPTDEYPLRVRLTGSDWGPDTGRIVNAKVVYEPTGYSYGDYTQYRFDTVVHGEMRHGHSQPNGLWSVEVVDDDQVTYAVQGALDTAQAILAEAEKAIEAHTAEHKAIFDERSRLQGERRRAGIAVAQLKVTLEDLA